MVLLVSSDSEQFFVDKDVAERSALITKMLKGKNTSLRFSLAPPLLTIWLNFRRRGERPTSFLASSLFVRAKKGSWVPFRPHRGRIPTSHIGLGILRIPPWRASPEC